MARQRNAHWSRKNNLFSLFQKLGPLNAQNAMRARMIVDPVFYWYRHADVAAAGMDSYLHFSKFGWKERRDPNPFTHIRFVEKQYPEFFKNFRSLHNVLSQKIYHNALMRKPATLREIEDAARHGNDAYTAIFKFDVDRYCREQKDVFVYSDFNPVQHLFYDGLFQNRLREGGHLNAAFFDLTGYENDYEFLIAQQRPLDDADFGPINLSVRSRVAAVDVSRVVLGIGTLLYNNNEQQVARLLKSVQANFRECAFKCELRIWDNSPYAMDSDALRQLCPDLEIHFAAHPENPGFAAGHNGLMEECFDAGCTHYLGLNPDGHLLPGAVKNAVRFAMSKAGPSLIELEAEPLSHPKWYHPVTGQTDWVSGAAFLMDAEAYSVTRGFDPDFPMYCEDVDLSFRAFQAGVGLYVASNARFYHDTNYRQYTSEPWRDLRSLVGAWYLCEKWGNTGRAHVFLAEIKRQKGAFIQLPSRPDVVPEVPPKIQQLLGRERFAKSRFWGN